MWRYTRNFAYESTMFGCEQSRCIWKWLEAISWSGEAPRIRNWAWAFLKWKGHWSLVEWNMRLIVIGSGRLLLSRIKSCFIWRIYFGWIKTYISILIHLNIFHTSESSSHSVMNVLSLCSPIFVGRIYCGRFLCEYCWIQTLQMDSLCHLNLF